MFTCKKSIMRLDVGNVFMQFIGRKSRQSNTEIKDKDLQIRTQAAIPPAEEDSFATNVVISNFLIQI